MDFAPSFTPRYLAHYRSAGKPHTWLFRGFRDESGTLTVSRGQSAARGLVQALEDILPDDFTFESAFYIPQDTDVSEIADLPLPVTGTALAGGFSAEDSAKFVRFAGKAVGGSKVSITVFGVQLVTDAIPSTGVAKFVVTAAESTIIRDAIDSLQGANLACVNNNAARWYARATIKTNDHWIKEIRNG